MTDSDAGKLALELSQRMMTAAEAGDMDTIRACYTPDATLWLNITGETLAVDVHVERMKGLRSKIENIRYTDIRVDPFEGGYVQRHNVLGTFADGSDLFVAACFVVHVRDGKICRREEYIDSSALSKALS